MFPSHTPPLSHGVKGSLRALLPHLGSDTAGQRCVSVFNRGPPLLSFLALVLIFSLKLHFPFCESLTLRLEVIVGLGT